MRCSAGFARMIPPRSWSSETPCPGGGTLTTDIAAVRAAVNRATASGATSLIDGAAAGLLLARSAPNRRVLLCLFSDGVDTSSWMSDEATTDLAKGMDAVFYAVTNIRPDRDEFLDRLSRETGGDVLHLGPEDDLSGAFETVLDAFRHRYLLGFVPTGVATDGWHSLKVRVRRKDVVVRAALITSDHRCHLDDSGCSSERGRHR